MASKTRNETYGKTVRFAYNMGWFMPVIYYLTTFLVIMGIGNLFYKRTKPAPASGK